MKTSAILLLLPVLLLSHSCEKEENTTNENSDLTPVYSYKVVDTDVAAFYDDHSEIAAPAEGEVFYGQDAHYDGFQPSYTDNGDGTVTDNVTELMWSQAVNLSKVTLDQAQSIADTMTLAGYSDWRVPNVKELYSLILFSGYTGSQTDYYSIPDNATPFIDTEHFGFAYGDVENGERYIDAQWLSSTVYTSTVFDNQSCLFGVNFADGRIKGYPYETKTFYVRFVRGNESYGENILVDNGDGTVSDLATGLMWQQADDGTSRNWQEALAYAENLELAGHSNWRLPNAKELQSIVDYSRSPDATDSPAIDPLFELTEIKDPDGNDGQYPYYWTSTTHLDGPEDMMYSGAAYIAFGEAQGQMFGALMDVHGAGAQRSDPKTGNAADYPQYFGPQGDVRYVYNYVLAVRNIE